jgi:hypothetical protein
MVSLHNSFVLHFIVLQMLNTNAYHIIHCCNSCICDGGNSKSSIPSIDVTATPSVSSEPTASLLPTSAPSSSPSQCIDDPNWFFDIDPLMGCAEINGTDPEEFCNRYKFLEYEGKTATNACCICGGGKLLSRQPSESPSLSQTPSITPSVSQQPSTKPSTLPSSMPSQSSLPSSFPSVTNRTVLDMQLCRHHEECRSGVCSEISDTESNCAPGVSFAAFFS